jgi:hypothetical protein
MLWIERNTSLEPKSSRLLSESPRDGEFHQAPVCEGPVNGDQKELLSLLGGNSAISSSDENCKIDCSCVL